MAVANASAKNHLQAYSQGITDFCAGHASRPTSATEYIDRVYVAQAPHPNAFLSIPSPIRNPHFLLDVVSRYRFASFLGHQRRCGGAVRSYATRFLFGRRTPCLAGPDMRARCGDGRDLLLDL